MCDGPTLFTQLTPVGRGAIATLLLSGEHAVEIADRFFHSASGKSIAQTPTEKILFGNWQVDAAQPGEELVVCRTSADEVEIHCHGGVAAIKCIQDSLAEAGCFGSDWQQVAQIESINAIAAEARIALAKATTNRTAAILLDQLHGSLGDALRSVVQHLEAGDVDTVRIQLSTLLERAAIGKHLTSPFRVVLAGLPNVGKSSLLNALLGYSRAIVYDQPGTTRDVLTGMTAFDGWPVELSDTAGVRDTSDDIEAQGVHAARQRLLDADLILLVCDASVPPDKPEQRLIDEFPSAIVAYNKCDLGISPSRESEDAIRISALTGDGLDDLIAVIVKRLVPVAIQAGDAVPFTARQIDAIESALNCLDAGNGDEAITTIRELIEKN